MANYEKDTELEHHRLVNWCKKSFRQKWGPKYIRIGFFRYKFPLKGPKIDINNIRNWLDTYD